MQVSVLMPVYNAGLHVSHAIESVLAQVYENIEFVIIDDGSTDNTLSVAESYAQKDNRVKIISHPNMGMGKTLNQGLDFARNEWVVRMDADDIMLPNRIERQVAFIKEYKDIAVASTLVYYINDNGKVIGRSPYSPLTSRAKFDKYIRQNQLRGKSDLEALPIFGFPHLLIYHPTVIMRRSIIKEVGGYRQKFWPADDLDLWNRIVEHGHTILVQPEYLLEYRRHGTSASFAEGRVTWLKNSWVVACALRRRSGRPEPSWEEFLEIRRQAPWWNRINQARKDLAKTLYNAALSHYSSRRYHLCASTLLGAGLLQPVYVLRRVLRLT